jgi:hypothetical protein
VKVITVGKPQFDQAAISMPSRLAIFRQELFV